MTQRLAILTGLLLALSATHAHAQRHHLVPGSRVRVWPCGRKAAGTAQECRLVTGEFTARTGDKLNLASAAGTVTAVPLSPGAGVDVHAGRRGHAFLGLTLGAAGGLAAGTAYAFGTGCDYGPFGEAGSVEDEGFCTLYGVVPMAVGAAAGTLVGLLIRTDRWEPVDASDLSVTIVPRPAGVGVGLTLAF
ncbi:MAG TPA: hypothetical protein VFN83_03930 [Gemmatimonadales bacterium]|jgi:hypothetical protein|nr:hypothetical protein [Gemmatimonadales bacterium]